MSSKKTSAILLCLLFYGLLPFSVVSTAAESGGSGDHGTASTRDLSIGATRALYEAQRLIRRKEYGQAAGSLEKFIDKHPGQDHCYLEFTLGNALYFSGRKEASLARYQAAVALDSGYGPAWVNLGQLAYELKRYDLAADALIKGFRRAEGKEKDPDLLYYAAVAYIMGGRKGQAAPILEALVAGKHGNPRKEWFHALMKVYLDLDREGDAEGLLNRMIDRYADEPETWKIAYEFEANRRHYKSAAIALTIYSYLKPLTREETVLLGDLYAAIKAPVVACAYYEKAFAPGASPEEYERLASAYLSAHRPDKARRTLTEALKKTPTATLWSLAGDLRYMEGDFDGAYHAFEQSARLDPKGGRAYLMMATCALQAHRNKEAAEALNKARGFPKQRKQAMRLLKYLD